MATRHFSVDVDRSGAVIVLAVHGDADLATVPEFAVVLWRAIDAGERRLIIDLCETRFVDSKMIELLLSAAARVKRQERKMAIACGSESICRVLELCGVTRMLPVRATREEALIALAS